MSKIKTYFKSRWDSGVLVELDFCLVPETRVLTHDFKHVPIESLEVGQKLVGFDETLRKYGGTTFRVATITNKKTLYKPCIKLTFSDGTSVVGSTDHMWVASPQHKKVASWYKMEDITPGFRFSQVCELWEDKQDEKDYAWMGGFLDGEGWISQGNTFGVGQNIDEAHQPIWDKFLPILKKDFKEIALSKNKASKVVQARPYGLRTAWTAVGLYQPVRLLRTLQNTYPGTIVRSKRIKVREVVSVEYIGKREVVAIETDTHTFIAEGMLSHNCQLEVIVLAYLTQDVQLMTDLVSGLDMHCYRAAELFGYTYDEFLSRYKAGEDGFSEKRRLAKTLSFQLQYGSGPKNMAEQNGIELIVAKRFIEQYYDRYPDVERWQQNNILTVKLYREPTTEHTEAGFPRGIGYLPSVTGRVYTFKEYDNTYNGRTTQSFSPTQIKNYPVQGLATGDIVPMVLGRMWRYLKNADTTGEILLVNTIHDSILLDCKSENIANMWIPKLLSIMRSAPDYFKDAFGEEFNLELTAEAKIGPTWGEMKKWQPNS